MDTPEKNAVWQLLDAIRRTEAWNYSNADAWFAMCGDLIPGKHTLTKRERWALSTLVADAGGWWAYRPGHGGYVLVPMDQWMREVETLRKTWPTLEDCREWLRDRLPSATEDTDSIIAGAILSLLDEGD